MNESMGIGQPHNFVTSMKCLRIGCGETDPVQVVEDAVDDRLVVAVGEKPPQDEDSIIGAGSATWTLWKSIFELLGLK